MRLVQSDFEHAAHHLHAAGETLRRRVDEGDILGSTLAAVATFATTRRRWRAAFQHDGDAVGLVAIGSSRTISRPAPGPAGPSRARRIFRGRGSSRRIGWRGRRQPDHCSSRSTRTAIWSARRRRQRTRPSPPMQISTSSRPASIRPRPWRGVDQQFARGAAGNATR